MRRREFIAFLSLGIVMGSLAGARVAEAQSASRVWQVGYLSGRNGSNENSRSFVQGLRELGYVEGRNVVVEYRFARGKNERLTQLAAELVR